MTDTKSRRVLVCGGRDYQDRRTVFETLDAICGDGLIVIHGAARGADSLASEWARERWQVVRSFPADWNKHGRSAGCIRNQQMLAEGTPDLVVAFPGGRGTADMVRRAKAAGVEVMEIK